ncbi:type II toxin-antitoxin system RelE/ParE family toxin [Roseofilum casamattae]|uniref:Type II toxin-antitoxin system RelE/ParE family toxin n=1 Tax=Roseofilum casamattae BLCC-M143 TaxID=3022442 RepID=A0ABT7BZ87_9CYAN|nr:type II toxin-antitoxin system RelE/ParE family toxin [Roseofilum casamattae]MDJ1184515.1 type II toxin-antitoxin system RelE/ParE family toxin [Roseofilum casamattae BLCC-M143]
MTEKYQVIIQPEAEQGIKEAYYWVSNYSPRQGRNWLEGIYKAIMSLEQMSLRCSLAFENNYFAEEIRQLLYGKGKNTYRILFTVTDRTVHILYVRHCAQQPLSPDEE